MFSRESVDFEPEFRRQHFLFLVADLKAFYILLIESAKLEVRNGFTYSLFLHRLG